MRHETMINQYQSRITKLENDNDKLKSSLRLVFNKLNNLIVCYENIKTKCVQIESHLYDEN